MGYLPVTLVFAVAILVSIYFMFITTPSELAPTEDQSILFFQATAPQTATIDYDEAYTRQIVETFETFPEYQESFFLLGRGEPTTVFGGFKMPPPSERERSQDIQPILQGKLKDNAGLDAVAFPRSSLPGSGGGLPVQFVITSDADYRRLTEVADGLIGRAMQSGRFIFLQKAVEFTRPKTTVVVDRDRAGELDIRMSDIGRNLAGMLGGNYINRFSLEGRSYKVIPQVSRRFRLDHRMLDQYYIRTGGGRLVPLSTVVSFERTVEPSQRTQFQQLNEVTVQGVMSPATPLGEALGYLEQQAREIFPKGFTWDYKGASRQYAKESGALMITFFMSLLVIYLVLAAQFESWRDPFIILVSVPMSIAGAMAFMTLGFATVNIYTQVGLVTLIGLIAKNGILIVQFANQVQIREGLGKRAAVVKAARIRLRPILMTTAAMVFAMIPLLTATGPGAVSRFHIGLVIATGLGIGTLFTLFVVPAVYLLLARAHQAEPAPE